jgi:myo-inositol 2-dehydrogenase / D-chiro-inositol 1-dehydrogenase
MNKPEMNPNVSRRQFIRASSLVAAGAVVAPHVLTVKAADDTQIKVGLIGCGGRGKGAVENVKEADKNVKIVAVADVFADRSKGAAQQFGVPSELCFDGFDAYKKVLEIPDINYIILATPPGFRPVHFPAAIAAGKNVFCEKPVAVDGPGARAMFKAGEMATEKKLCVVAGTQRRHEVGYLETIKRLQDGAIGDIVALRGYWNQGAIWNNPWRDNVSDTENQLRNWYHYLWLCGDHICEQHVHNIDVCNWVMNAFPVKAYGMGGRQWLSGKGEIWDHFAIEFEYANGTRFFSQCRQIPGCADNVSEAVMGTKGTSNPGGSISVKGGESWRNQGRGKNPYVQEHIDLIAAIRGQAPYVNETKTVTSSTLTAIMGRESAYSGQTITWDQILNSTMNTMPASLDLKAPMPSKGPPMPGKYKLV